MISALSSVTTTSVNVTLPVLVTTILKYLIWSPTSYGPSLVTPLVSDSIGVLSMSTTVASLGSGVLGLSEGTSGVGSPSGSLPVTIAWFTTVPASISDCVTRCLASTVAVAFGASCAIGVPAMISALSSVTVTLVSVTLPM